MKAGCNDISQELLEAIERYINGSMELKERKDFDDYLKIDPEFKLQVENIKAMIQGIETQSLKEELDRFHDEIENDKYQLSNSTKDRLIKSSKIAVAIALIAAIGSIWFFSSNPNKKLYTKYFAPHPGLQLTRNNTSNFDFYEAMQNYERGDYKKAINQWEQINEKNDTLNYFMGLAYMNEDKVLEAIPFLERAVHAKNSFPFLKDAHYYLGLAYLKEGNTKLAKNNFNLSGTDSSKSILKELEN